MAPSRDGDPVGIYVHIPFCSHVCPYCDFNTYAGKESLIPRYLCALETDIRRSGTGRAASTIFFGGGTPSLISAEGISRLIECCRNAFSLPPSAEITLEANPAREGGRYLTDLRRAGVNRISIGVQTFDRRGLRVLGRQHEAEESKQYFRAAKEAGFDNVSLDLIFGWPEQTLERWKQDLDRVLQLGPDHLSLYNLIVEPGTPMAEAVSRKILSPAGDDLAADMYELAIDTLQDADWNHYEVANWAREYRYQSRHNTIYWRNGEYAHFGAGAFGRIGRSRSMNHLAPLAYIEAVEGGQTPRSNIEEIDAQTSMAESIMLGLRLLEEGVTEHEFAARHGLGLQQVFGKEIEQLRSLNLVDVTSGRVRLTRRGLLLANDVAARFI